LRRALQVLWALPTSLVGVLLAVLGGATPYRLVQGELWQWRAQRGFWAWLNRRSFIATTMGNVSIFSPDWVDDTITQKHEAVHVAQAYRWGPLFLFVYLAQWALVGFEYSAIPLEQEAYSRQRDEWPL
jgi:hypothetical protein